jgi:integrase
VSISDRPAAYGRRVNPMLHPAPGQAPPNKGKKYPPEPLNQDEVMRLMAACGRGPGAFRNRAIIAVMWRSGLRVSEALALEVKDVDFEIGTIRVLHGKGDKSRLVHMDAQTAAVIEAWLTRRNRIVVLRRAPLFCTYERSSRMGQPLRPAYMNQALKRAAKRAGIEKRVHNHGLRHTFAFELRLENRDLAMISEALGHSDYGSTQRYIKHLAPIARVRELRDRAWPATPSASGERPPAAA